MKPCTHKIQYYETDRMGITHHSNYIRFMEEARVDFLEQIGWSYEKLEAMGIISPVTEVSCQYKKSTTFSDVIRTEVRIEEFNGVRLKIRYRMTNEEGAVVCEARSCHCFLNEKGIPVRLKRDFSEFYEALVSLIEPAEGNSASK